MTQAWQEERASKGGYGVGAESVANAEEGPSNHLRMTNWGTGGRIHSSGALTPPQFFPSDMV